MLRSFSLYLTKSASTILSLISLSLTACYFPPSLFLSLLLFFSTSLSHSYLPPPLSPSVLHPSLSYQLPLSISFCAHVNPCTYIPFSLAYGFELSEYSLSHPFPPSPTLSHSLSHPFPPSFSLSHPFPPSQTLSHTPLPPSPTLPRRSSQALSSSCRWLCSTATAWG